jgi:type IV pilus assembly protein PilA
MIHRMRQRGFTLIELMIVVAIIGILAAIAIPNFIKFQARSKQGEAKANLKSLFTAERSLLQERDRYSADLGDVGFAPERGNRYAYQLGDAWLSRATVTADAPAGKTAITVDTFKFGTAVSTNPTPALKKATAYAAGGGEDPPATYGVAGTCPACNFQGAASGMIDTDASVDSWHIASKDHTVDDKQCNTETGVPAGVPYNDLNDVDC